MFTILDAGPAASALALRMERATEISPDLLWEFVASCDRLRLLQSLGKALRFDALVAGGAFTEAALELVAIEAPQWSVQRLCRDNGEWFCALSRHPDTPEWLDEAAEASHRSLPLAILGALVEARARHNAAPAQEPLTSGHPRGGVPSDCDDYR